MDKRKIEILFSISFLIIVITSFIYIPGTYQSGFQLTDDHEIISIIDYHSKNHNLIDTTTYLIDKDLNRDRFRPLYYIHRLFQSLIFHMNYYNWSFYLLILGLITSICLYLFGKYSGFSNISSIFLSLFSLIGTQMSIWYRLGPAESIGMTTFSLGILFMAKSRISNRKLYTYLFILFISISTLCKESFILTIPAIIALLVLHNHEKKDQKLITSIKSNFLVIITLSLIFFIEIFIIKFFIGTSRIGYAGYDGINLEIIIYNIFNAGYVKFLFGTTFIIFFVILVIYVHSNQWIKYKSYILSLTGPVFIFLLFFIPQMILYMNSGMFERYLIPSTFAFAFLIGNFESKITFDRTNVKNLICLILILPIIASSYIAINGACEYTYTGSNQNELLLTVVESSDSSSKILVIVDPALEYEWSYSVQTFLKFFNRTNIYYYGIYRDDYSSSEKELVNVWNNSFDEKTEFNWTEIEYIVFLNGDYFNAIDSEIPTLTTYSSKKIGEYLLMKKMN